MASGSVCPSGKCVCNSCGLEIVDKYLLKVGRSREAQGERGHPGSSAKREKFLFLLFSIQVLAGGLRLSKQKESFLSRATRCGGRVGEEILESSELNNSL